MQERAGASEGELGLALLAVGLGAVPAMLAAGRLVNRRGARVLPAALVALAVAAALPATAGSVAVLAAGLLALGAASGAVDVAVNAAAGAYEAETGTRVMQLAHALFSFGLLVGAVAAGLARELGAGPPAVLAGAAVALLAAAAANAGRPVRAPAAAAPAPLRLRRAALVLGLVCAASFLVEGGIEAWSALFLEREHGARPALASLGPAAYALAMVAGRLSGQWLTERLPDRALLGGGALVSVAGLLAAAGSPSAPVALAALLVAGAGVSVVAPVAFGAAARRAPAGQRGGAVAAVTTIGYTGFLAGPVLIGGVADALGLRAAFATLALAALALALASPRLALDGGRPAPASAR